MKWTTMQLDRYVNEKLEFDFETNLDEYIKNVDDILKIDKVRITGEMLRIDDRYMFQYNVSATLYLQCAVSLEEVEFEINSDFKEIFSKNPTDDENEVDGITIDLSKVIWLNILAVKPMRIVKEGVRSPFKEEKKERKKNLQFKDLEKYL